MPALPRRTTAWVFCIALLMLALAGGTDEAAAQVYQGPLDFVGLPAFIMTVTLQPSGPALYTIQIGSFTDRGFVVASVVGSIVTGFFQTTTFPHTRACFFQGPYDGTTATLTLDPLSCGAGGGTLTLTRIG